MTIKSGSLKKVLKLIYKILYNYFKYEFKSKNINII